MCRVCAKLKFYKQQGWLKDFSWPSLPVRRVWGRTNPAVASPSRSTMRLTLVLLARGVGGLINQV